MYNRSVLLIDVCCAVLARRFGQSEGKLHEVSRNVSASICLPVCSSLGIEYPCRNAIWLCDAHFERWGPLLSSSGEGCRLSWHRGLQDLPRGDLQRLGENASLEDDARHQRWPFTSGLRGLSRPWGGPCGQWRRQNQNFRLSGAFLEGDQRSLPHLPRIIHRAHERRQFLAPPGRCELHFLPLAASCANKGGAAG